MIVVVEPHADDAFLSVGGLLERWIAAGIPCTIVTVYSGTRKRAVDARAYADAIGAKWYGMGEVEFGSMKPGDPAGEIKHGVPTPIFEAATVLLPLGIGGHPEHHAVRDLFHDALVAPALGGEDVTRWGAPVLYYVDQPYATKLKNQDELTDKLTDRKIFAIMRPGARKYRHVKLFKDQAYFFFNENGKDDTLAWKSFELVVY